jgi:SRSO17 transposase
VRHREKWRLALDLIDEAISWGLTPQVIVADAGYGQITAFRHGLAERGLDFVVAVRSDECAHPHDAVPTTPAERKSPVNRDREATAYRATKTASS